MSTQRAPQPPSLGRIVIYRTRGRVDIAALITALVPERDGTQGLAVHLEQFPPPGVAKDNLSYQWGADYSVEPRPGTWRWPERVG